MQKLFAKVKSYVTGLVTWNWIVILFIAVFQKISHLMMTTPTGPFADSIGMTGTIIGTAASIYTFACVLTRPFAGTLTDRVSPKKLLAGVFILRAITCVMYTFTNSMPMFFLTRFMQGVCFAALGSCIPAINSRCVSRAALGMSYSVMAALQKLLSALAPVWARTLYTDFGFKEAYLAAGAVSLVPVALVFLLRENKEAEAEAVAANAKKEKKPFNPLKGICWFAIGIAGLGFFLIVPYYATDMFGMLYYDAKGMNYATGLAVASGLGVVYGLFVGALVDAFRKKPEFLVIPAICMLAGCLFIHAYATETWQMTLGCCIYYFGWNACEPIILSTLFRVVPQDQAGAASSTWFLALDVSGLVMNPVVGVLGDTLGYAGAFKACALAPALALVVFLVFGMPKIKKANLNAEANT